MIIKLKYTLLLILNILLVTIFVFEILTNCFHEILYNVTNTINVIINVYSLNNYLCMSHYY